MEPVKRSRFPSVHNVNS